MSDLGYSLLQKGEDTYLCICVNPPGSSDCFTEEDRELLNRLTDGWSEICECVWYCPGTDKVTVVDHVRSFQLAESATAERVLSYIDEEGHLNLGEEEDDEDW